MLRSIKGGGEASKYDPTKPIEVVIYTTTKEAFDGVTVPAALNEAPQTGFLIVQRLGKEEVFNWDKIVRVVIVT